MRGGDYVFVDGSRNTSQPPQRRSEPGDLAIENISDGGLGPLVGRSKTSG